MDIGAPDRSSRFQWMLYMSRSPLQSFLEVQESWFQVRPCHDQRSTFYWNMFWSSPMSLTYAEGTLLGHPWANVKNERNVSTHWIITCQIQQCEYWSILCIEGCQFGCQQCSGNAPVDLVREERQTELVNLLMDKASWLHGWASSTAVAQGCQLQRIYSFSYQIFAFDYAFLAGEMNWISAYVTIILSVRVGIVHSRRRNIRFLRKSCEFRLRHPFGKKHHFIF